MTSNVNIALPRSGVITGTVTDAISSAPISGIEIEAIAANGVPVSFGSTNASGQYTIELRLANGNI